MKNKGFTLIELIVVMVILGILAATAAPKFINLQSDARIAALSGLSGAIKSANNLFRSKAMVQGASFNSNWYKDCSNNSCVEVEGKKFHAKYGYMDRSIVAYMLANNPVSNFQNNIAAAHDTMCTALTTPCETDWCDCKADTIGDVQIFVLSGFVPGNYATEKCYLRYHQATKEAEIPTVTIISDGC